MSSAYTPSSTGYNPSRNETRVSDEDEDGHAGRASQASSRLRSLREDLEDVSDTESIDYKPSHVDPATDSDEDGDREYRVEPLQDIITPRYSPSQPADSASESENDDPREEGAVGHRTWTDSSPLPYDPSTPVADEVSYRPAQQALASQTDHSEILKSVDFDENHGDKGGEDFEGFDGAEQAKSQVDGIIADIFGESDAEEEEFEGFAENEVEKEAAGQEEGEEEEQEEVLDEEPTASTLSRHHHQQQEDDEVETEEFESDFDKILSKKREETRRKRRLGKDDEFLNDSDDIIRETILQMRQTAEEDRFLLAANRPATKKLAMLNVVSSLLKKADLKAALVDNGMLSAITDWLSPLPGQTLPNVIIRETMLRHLAEFSNLEPETLRESGIGKAVMYLYRHPRENRDNKRRAGHLINEWSRPIFNLTSDYRTLTKEERKQLDYEHLPKRRTHDSEEVNRRDINREMDGEQQGVLRPGDPGWVSRARVPQPSNKDYVVRPKWNLPSTEDQENDEDEDEKEGGDQPRRHRMVGGRKSQVGTTSRIETHIHALTKNAAVRRKNRFVRAVPMSIEGRKMAL
ncbi:Transcription factor iws1 [Sparganum proliferum]